MSHKKTTEEFIQEAQQIHANYDYSNVDYKGNKIKVLIACDKGHQFWQSPNHHLRGQVCPYCTGNVKITKEEFIQRATQKHNSKYDYSQVTDFNSIKDKVTIICPIHGAFRQTVGSHMQYGCRKCGRDTLRKTTDAFIKKLKDLYGDEYDYSLVDFKDRETPIKLICKKHGVFERIPRNLLKNKCGCVQCYKESTRITQEEFIERAQQINGNKFDYSNVHYINMLTPITIICNKGHEFKQVPQMHLFSFAGCPICASECKSKGEHLIRTYLKKHNVKFDEQKTFDGCKYKSKLLFDFYIPQLNTCIEYQGQQHYEPVHHFGGEEDFQARIIRDNIKREYCAKNKINLLEIKYNENVIKRLDKYLNKEVL